MKKYTTPTFTVTIEGQGEILALADSIIATVSDGTRDIDVTPSVNGDEVSFTLTQQQTGILDAGNIYVEITIKLGDRVWKTKTIKTRIEDAIREKEVE